MFEINEDDKNRQIPDRCSFGIGFRIDSNDLEFVVKDPNFIDLFDKDKGKLMEFNFYKNTGCIFYYVNDQNVMRLTREILIQRNLVTDEELNDWVSTNGDDNFIPLAIRRRLGKKLTTTFNRYVIPRIISLLTIERDHREKVLRRILDRSGFKDLQFKPIKHFVLTSGDTCLDVAVQPGICFDQDNEYERRMAHLIVSGHRGRYASVDNQILPAAAFDTKKGFRLGVPCNIAKLIDGSVIEAYIKEMPVPSLKNWHDHAWQLRLEHRRTSENCNEDINRHFKDADGLKTLFKAFADETFTLLARVLTPPFPGNDSALMYTIFSLIDHYAPYRSHRLIQILTTHPGQLTVKVAEKLFRYKTQIRTLERHGILIRPHGSNGRYFVLNWHEFGRSVPSLENLKTLMWRFEIARPTDIKPQPVSGPSEGTWVSEYAIGGKMFQVNGSHTSLLMEGAIRILTSLP